MDYQEYLQTDHWKQVRKRARKRAGNHCQICGNRSKLETHHNNYDNLGHEKNSDVIVLCDSCHMLFHGKLPEIGGNGHGFANDWKSYKIANLMGISSELYVLLAVACNYEIFSEIRKKICLDDLEDRRARKFFVALEECYRQGEMTEEALLGRLEDEELRELLLGSITSNTFKNAGRLISEGLREIIRRSLEKLRRANISALVRSNKDSDPKELKQLLVDKIYLDKELQKLRGMTT